MANVTTFEDVDKSQKRSLPTEDKPWIEDLIRKSEAILSIRRGDVEDWVAEQNSDKRRQAVKDAVTNMVGRVLKNPDGFATEADGDYSYGRPRELAAGELYASITDLQLLGLKTGRRRAKSMRLTLPSDSPRNMKVGGL